MVLMKTFPRCSACFSFPSALQRHGFGTAFNFLTNKLPYMKDRDNDRQTTDAKTEKKQTGNENIAEENKTGAERLQTDDDDTSDYVVIESGLGIDE
jgi:hypothetical protein